MLKRYGYSFPLQIFLLLCLCYSDLHAGIERYFKKAGDKSGNHKMKNIDFIYVLNLDQRPEKLQICTEQLSPYGIYPFRFSAVNGWELSLHTINDVSVKFKTGMRGDFWGTYYPMDPPGEAQHELIQQPGRGYFCHCMSRGAIGIVLSHLSILQDAYDSGYETIWVMEDDIQIIQNPHLLSDLITKLDHYTGKKGWDMLFTDQDTKNQQGEYVPCFGYALRPNFIVNNPERFKKRINIHNKFTRIGARYGAYSVIVRRSGMKKILDFIKKHQIFLPYDMDFPLIPDIQMFAVVEDVISTIPQAHSDNGGPNYRKNIQ
jgi:GR25 family glycosyltransferase involved in LPS biosynthesis